ncbi:hypothetical protein AB1I58_03715 [Enterococcus hirae]|uniref:hypothetical protein n=1 Tax=Enterococcus hirae TaxID=1354 RepID=UPI0019F94EB6|nr:hypothetical protein [Enterococcus hirae]
MGEKKVDSTTQTFIVGTKTIFITALVETTPDAPAEDTSKPNEEDPIIDSSMSEPEEKQNLQQRNRLLQAIYPAY